MVDSTEISLEFGVESDHGGGGGGLVIGRREKRLQSSDQVVLVECFVSSVISLHVSPCGWSEILPF